MASKYVLYLFVMLYIKCVAGQSQHKSSLTFVIDDSASMGDDIAQVKRGVREIFETVKHHKSQIENFILITFSDYDYINPAVTPAPGIRVRTITTKYDEFDLALSSIVVAKSNGDCPEYSISGIMRALEISLPGSYIYVFTDATAKDYHRFEEVKSLAHKKSSQVVFVLTGDCYGSKDTPEYQVYYDMARATNGEVFNLETEEIGRILDYVKISIEGRRTFLANKSLPPGSHIITFDADPEVKNPTISLGTLDPHPSVDITGPDGSKPAKTKILKTKTNTVYGIDVITPGLHTVEVTSTAGTHAVVTARSDINFQHGFSTSKPSSIDSTSTKPVSDIDSYVSIKLTEGDVELKTVKILDTSDNLLEELTLAISDEKTKFYVSTKPFVPPNTTFRIAITAYDPKSKSFITRTALTPVEVQKILPGVAIVDKTPSVVIGGDAKIHTEYDEHLELVCKVNGYTKPDIIWKNKDTGINLSGKESVVEYPYDYISILTIEKVNENATYECKASNPSGSDVKVVAVETKPKPHYFNVLDPRKKMKIDLEFEKEGHIRCLVDAYPPVEITWYKDGTQLSSGGNIELSANNSTVTIKNTTYFDKGRYKCEAKNEDRSELLYKIVKIVGVESPVIDKSVTEVTCKKGSSAVIECKILQGIPKPTISWFYATGVASEEVKLLDEWEDKETIVVENARTNDSGTYQCQAENDVSRDIHDIKLIVELLPTIAKGKSFIQAVSGSVISISCNVDGGPPPYVAWFKDGVNITNNDGRQNIFGNQTLTLKLAVKPSDSGNYTCRATNRLGEASRTVMVEVIVPASIRPPDNSKLSVIVGTKLTLPCKAEGLPKPEIKWIYKSFSPSTPLEKIIKEPLHIRRVQLSQAGLYTCVARNSGGTERITYTIQVIAPPIIENTYKDKHFFAVEGDLALRITCKAIGYPKPDITWSKDGWNLVLGTTYNVEEETLIIRNVPRDAQAAYTCKAKNVIGSAQEVYEISVTEYPMPGRVTSFIPIEEGKAAHIQCNIPHKRIDQLRWFKNGKLIHTGELTLTNSTLRDSGYYICRVGDFFKSISDNVRIDVGYKPTFTTEEDVDIEMVEGPPVSLICETRSEPKPDVSWFHDGKILNETSAVLNFPMGINSPGQYRCEVQNSFGAINRIFNVVPRDCFVNTDKLTKLQPLMLTSGLKWPEFDRSEKFIIFPRGEQFVLFCPSRFKLFPKKYITAFCNGGMNLMINGIKYDYADIQCTEEVTHLVQRTGENCMRGNTEKVKVVYKVLGSETTEVYEICMDNTNNVPLYAMHVMQHSLAGDKYKTTWSDSDQFSINFEDLYNCKTQTSTISSWLSKLFHYNDECCFSKRQLVNPRDVFPGVAQRSTYSYLNVIPQWGTCNADNWDDIEQRVRNFARNLYGELLVWTGGAKELALTSSSHDTKKHFFRDRRGNQQPVPMFLWKVVQDPESKSSLAIVQVNVPDLHPSEVYKYILCRDVCDDTDWMKSPKWHDVERGYTYCCTLPEFEMAFGFEDVFDPDMNEILKSDATL